MRIIVPGRSPLEVAWPDTVPVPKKDTLIHLRGDIDRKFYVIGVGDGTLPEHGFWLEVQ